MKWLKGAKILGLTGLLASFSANASVIYDTWSTNEGISGNYRLEITDTGGQFLFNFTVDPWNAEGLGLFIDLGDFDFSAGVSTTDVIVPGSITTAPTTGGDVSVYAIDTTSDSCGPGCNVNGASPLLANPDMEWELVFRLATQGWDSIQTFQWSIYDFGLGESDFGLVGVRAQQLCSGSDLLPDDIEDCGGSDKAVGTPTDIPDPDFPVPLPGTLLLLGAGLIGLSLISRSPGMIPIRA